MDPTATQFERAMPLQQQLAPAKDDEQRDAKLDKKIVKEVRFATETEKLISSYNFYDEISSSCAEQLKANGQQNEQRPRGGPRAPK